MRGSGLRANHHDNCLRARVIIWFNMALGFLSCERALNKESIEKYSIYGMDIYDKKAVEPVLYHNEGFSGQGPVY